VSLVFSRDREIHYLQGKEKMREILFRGQRQDNREWVYGDLEHLSNGIITIQGHIVDPETVGQYTGLEAAESNRYITVDGERIKDLRIFEGDIVKSPLPAGLHSNGRTKLEERVAHVFYTDLAAAFWVVWESVYSPYRMYKTSPSKYKIIGNLFDIPELLEGNAHNVE
jgi:hypothetical protein